MTYDDDIKDLVGKNDSLRAEVWQLRHALETAKRLSRCCVCGSKASDGHQLACKKCNA